MVTSDTMRSLPSKDFMKAFFLTLVVIAQCLLLSLHALAHPGSGIAIDRKGNVFFTDTGHGIWKIDGRGKLVDLNARAFHWLTLDENGYFADTRFQFDKVMVDNPAPMLITASDFPITLGPDKGLYYAPYRDEQPLQIIRQTPDGKTSVWATIAANATGAPLKWLNGIAAGQDGSIYFTEDSAVRKVSPDGALSTLVSGSELGVCTPTPLPDVPTGPHFRGVAIDPVGVVYVTDTGCHQVLKITSRGKLSVALRAGGPWSPTGVAVSGGKVYVLEYDHRPVADRGWPPRVRKLTSDGKIVTLTTVVRK